MGFALKSQHNPLECSNLGNINLQSPEPLCKSPDENSRTTFYLNQTNPHWFSLFVCLICAMKRIVSVVSRSWIGIMWCVGGQVYISVSVNLFFSLFDGCIEPLEEGVRKGENSSSRWHKAGRWVHFLTGLTCSANKGNLALFFLSRTQTHMCTHIAKLIIFSLARNFTPLT